MLASFITVSIVPSSVVLRAYQRQDLYWMLQRESGQDDWEDLERELNLLSELS
jgi:hypothetical protein